ncbi:Aste57867_19366 [Aphanomyces stellatus]|uniref:Aste57867_19366 protein n=1 Tax=Aphanomyces stellatus TaxID=120398 RepID=A0A485LCM2_9STRA|nr:hypothetical protein As57867_019302 [Aphanomyces stellatus]VFT96080.1 Aste57867_19366 [Aphanomyces stellatus]
MASGSNAPTFLQKLVLILKQEDSSIVSWGDDGASIEIRDVAAFTAMLPKYFGHSKLESFQRQLNNYGFRKLPKHKSIYCTYAQPKFLRHEPNSVFWVTTNRKRKTRVGPPPSRSPNHIPQSPVAIAPYPPSTPPPAEDKSMTEGWMRFLEQAAYDGDDLGLMHSEPIFSAAVKTEDAPWMRSLFTDDDAPWAIPLEDFLV